MNRNYFQRPDQHELAKLSSRHPSPHPKTVTTSQQIKYLIAWIAYPGIMGLGLSLHWGLASHHAPLLFRTYSPVILASILITVLEHTFPYRRDWSPTPTDVSNDLKYLAVVQILLPKLLSFLITFSILKQVTSHPLQLGALNSTSLWPHHASSLSQAMLMLLSADFLRYWLHRFSHTRSPFLWRLHAVHHTPPKLYWMNVGRFHPLEKAVQFLCDSFPFLLLGVQAPVLALYFVFYSINGFFQHCNIAIQLGPLNYLISGPELHRWHHSTVLHQSNQNYGNNFIIWDLLFGTYYHPRQKVVRHLGLSS